MANLRRRLLLLPLGLRLFGARREPAAEDERVPTEGDDLNAFAAVYNDYVKTLAAGVIDLKKWDHVKRRWHSMTG